MEFDSTGKPIKDDAVKNIPPSIGAGFNGQSLAVMGVSSPAKPTLPTQKAGVITADSAASASESGMNRSGGVFGSIDMSGVNEILARENKVRAEMDDAQRTDNKPGGGVSVIGEGAVAERNRVNDERTQRWALDDIASRIKSAGSRSERSSLTQAMTTAMNNNVQQRGQDMNFAATISGQGITARGQDLSNAVAMSGQDVTMRGQDMNAARDDQRIGIDRSRLSLAEADQARVGEKFSLDKRIAEGQLIDSESIRSARSELNSALASGDPAKVAIARERAIAAGVKLERPNNEFTAVTNQLGGTTILNKDTGAGAIYNVEGKKVVDITAPNATKTESSVPNGYTVVGSSGGKRVLQDANGKRFIEGQ